MYSFLKLNENHESIRCFWVPTECTSKIIICYHKIYLNKKKYKTIRLASFGMEKSAWLGVIGNCFFMYYQWLSNRLEIFELCFNTQEMNDGLHEMKDRKVVLCMGFVIKFKWFSFLLCSLLYGLMITRWSWSDKFTC